MNRLKKGNASVYLVMLLCAIGAMVALRLCSSPSIGVRPDGTAGGDTLNVAIEISPMGVDLSGDTLSGVYYNMMRKACLRGNIPVRFVPFTQVDDALRGLDEGRWQVVIADIPATAQMKERYRLLNPVGIDRQLLIQLRDTLNVASHFDLSGREVVLPKGSPFRPRLEALAKELGDTINVREDEQYSSEQLIILVALGDIPFTVASEGVARPLLERYPQLDASVEISLSQFQSWAVAKNDSILANRLDSLLHN